MEIDVSFHHELVGPTEQLVKYTIVPVMWEPSGCSGFLVPNNPLRDYYSHGWVASSRNPNNNTLNT